MRLIDADAMKSIIERRRKAAKTLTGIDMVMLIDDAPTIGGWISVKDRMPECGYDVLVCNDDGVMGVACRLETSLHPQLWQYKYCLYDNDMWDDDEYGVITHWMPLPEPPKEEEGNNP